MIKLTASQEDYLETILDTKISTGSIRAVDISRKLNISRASVTEALKKLSEKGYLNYSHYGEISLTELGLEIASSVISKHNILKNFFKDFLKLSEEEATENACKIEHVITENAFRKISEIVNKS